MHFEDIFVFKAERFAVGYEAELDKYYLSIPVSNGLVEYDEYYEISKEQFEKFSASLAEMRELADYCKARKNDAQLIMKPGTNRGSPI